MRLTRDVMEEDYPAKRGNRQCISTVQLTAAYNCLACYAAAGCNAIPGCALSLITLTAAASNW